MNTLTYSHSRYKQHLLSWIALACKRNRTPYQFLLNVLQNNSLALVHVHTAVRRFTLNPIHWPILHTVIYVHDDMLLFGQLVRLLNSHSALPSILQNNLRELVYAHTADTIHLLSWIACYWHSRSFGRARSLSFGRLSWGLIQPKELLSLGFGSSIIRDSLPLGVISLGKDAQH